MFGYNIQMHMQNIISAAVKLQDMYFILIMKSLVMDYIQIE